MSPQESPRPWRFHHAPGPPTRRMLFRVLAIGLSLIIILLLSAQYVSFVGLQGIERAAAALEQEQTATTRIVAEIQGEQAALSAIFYKLSGDPETIDRQSIVDDLDEADRNLTRLLEEADRSAEEPLWRKLALNSSEFSKEARRLLESEDAETFLSADLFHRHDQIISIASKLVADEGIRARAAQTQIHVQSDQLRRRAALLMGACLLLALLCAVITVRMTTQLVHRMEQQALLMNQVSWHLLQSQEAAARRFSHELHDELGQSLAALKANLSTLQEASPIDHERLVDCRNLVDEAIRNVRELSHLLRPTILDDFGLEAGLRWLSEGFSHRTGVEANFTASYFGRLPDATETHLFRIAQEALTNISKHSKATRVDIVLTAKEDLVTLLIRDNGVGIVHTASGAASGLGLIGMQARAQSAGGGMSMKTAPGAGVEILISIPRQPQGAEQPQLQVQQSEDFHEREEDAHPARG